ncbi:hypothetical protein CMI37_37275 [Candidatus Pacearchaeota archaeon]|nr:hypothetical protein [Candidatus Pacearchaeota archaeon]|tara:strand:- start:4069 stop:7080 length:3012 start_codon:yes stop_codon:yes gene_type:complete
MGRPSCSSCCKVSVAIPQKKGCIDNNYKVYYKYGAGGWKTSDEYEDYLKNTPITIEVGIKVHYPIGSEDIYIVEDIIEGVAPEPDKVKLIDRAATVDISEVEPVKNSAGFRKLEEIKYVSSKSDYGEYASRLNCWNYPKSFFDASKTPVGNPWTPAGRKASDEINKEFQAGNPDYGIHIPKSWTITLGGNDEMVIVRKLEGLGSFTKYRESGAMNAVVQPSVWGQKDLVVDHLYEENLFRSWFFALWSGLPGEIDNNIRSWNYGGTSATNVQLQEKTDTVIWTTEILYKGQTIFSGSKCIPYKKEFHIYQDGVALTHEYALSRKDPSDGNNCWRVTRDFSGCGFLKGDEVFSSNIMQFDGSGSRLGGAWYPYWTTVWEDLVPYSNFSYCLTFPFFSFDHNTHYFYEGPDCDFISAPEGTIEEELDGKLEFYHADKELFTKLSVESKDFIVFNPYTGGLGRDVTSNELAQEYQGAVKNAAGRLLEVGERLQEDEPGIVGDTLKKQEIFVNRPFFQYTDNKLNLESDLPQELTIEESPIGNLIEFPAGWPGDYAQPNGVRETFSKYGGRTTGYVEDPNNPDVFVPGWGPDFHNDQWGRWQRNGTNGYDINDVIFVHFRTNRGADESGIDIEEDMEVYHPVGSNEKYTIKEILETGPDLKPTKVRIEKIRIMDDKVVDVSEIELVDDALYYAMNKRTYYLQTIYLKALSTKEGKDFYNPFKYRVTRIDFTNPDIDIDCVGNEIAGNPEMLDIEEGVKVLYPIGQVDENGDEIVPDEYTVAEIVERGEDDKPTEVRLSNPLADADGEVVDVSEVELINPSENPTYITMTTEYSYGNVPESRKTGAATFMKLSMEENAEDDMGGMGGMDGMGDMGDMGDMGGGEGSEGEASEGDGGGGSDGTITLEKAENPPIDLKDDIVITAPSSWSGSSEYDKITGKFGPRKNVLVFPRFENLYVKVLNNWVLQPTAAGDMDLAFGHRQLPKSGYFFGNFVELKFYLQEIEEWKKA